MRVTRDDTGPECAPGTAPRPELSPDVPEDPPKRVTKRRAETRRRLLDAALDVFAEAGFGRSTVEQVCQHAGYTRGAFYSNFASLDELFLAMWEERSARMLADLRDAVAAEDTAGGVDTAIPDSAPPTDASGPRASRSALADAVRRIVEVVPTDDRWYRVTAEFTAHALRNPPLKAVMAAREQAITATILPLIDAELARLGRQVTDRAALGRALVAVHDGTTVQCLLEPDDESITDLRADLFRCVLENYSEPSEV